MRKANVTQRGVKRESVLSLVIEHHAIHARKDPKLKRFLIDGRSIREAPSFVEFSPAIKEGQGRG